MEICGWVCKKEKRKVVVEARFGRNDGAAGVLRQGWKPCLDDGGRRGGPGLKPKIAAGA